MLLLLQGGAMAVLDEGLRFLADEQLDDVSNRYRAVLAQPSEGEAAPVSLGVIRSH